MLLRPFVQRIPNHPGQEKHPGIMLRLPGICPHMCRSIVDRWDEEHIVKKAASLRDLAQILPQTTENWEQPDHAEILPSGITNDPKENPPIARPNRAIQQLHHQPTPPSDRKVWFERGCLSNRLAK